MATEPDIGLAEDGVAPVAPTDVAATATVEDTAEAPADSENQSEAVTAEMTDPMETVAEHVADVASAGMPTEASDEAADEASAEMPTETPDEVADEASESVEDEPANLEDAMAAGNEQAAEVDDAPDQRADADSDGAPAAATSETGDGDSDVSAGPSATEDPPRPRLVERPAITAPKDIGDVPNDLSADDFAAAVERTVFEFKEGDIVAGTVVRVDPDEALVDIGYKSEGVIPANELSIRNSANPGEVVSVGDEIEALVMQKEDDNGRLVLSEETCAVRTGLGTHRDGHARRRHGHRTGHRGRQGRPYRRYRTTGLSPGLARRPSSGERSSSVRG